MRMSSRFRSKNDLSLSPAMDDKSVGTLGSKIRFSSFLDTMFLRLHRPTLNLGLGGGGGGSNSNKIEQMLKYWKASFSKCFNYFCRSLSGGYLCKLWRDLHAKPNVSSHAIDMLCCYAKLNLTELEIVLL